MPRKSNRLAAADRRRQILAVATPLFARQGFRGTTTRQIAERARVNEAIVFRHFPHKDDLYWAILDGKCRSAGGRQQLEAELRAGADEEETFAAIAEGILQRNTKDASHRSPAGLPRISGHGGVSFPDSGAVRRAALSEV